MLIAFSNLYHEPQWKQEESQSVCVCVLKKQHIFVLFFPHIYAVGAKEIWVGNWFKIEWFIESTDRISDIVKHTGTYHPVKEVNLIM